MEQKSRSVIRGDTHNGYMYSSLPPYSHVVMLLCEPATSVDLKYMKFNKTQSRYQVN